MGKLGYIGAGLIGSLLIGVPSCYIRGSISQDIDYLRNPEENPRKTVTKK